jgi:hypothetical protein
MSDALARSRSTDALVRLQATHELASIEGAEAETRLAELMLDETEVETEPADFMREEPVTEVIANAAYSGLLHRRAYRTLLAWAPRAPGWLARNCAYSVATAGMQLLDFSDAELETMVALAVEQKLDPYTLAVAKFEQAFIPRARSLPPEALWHARLTEHPRPEARAAALVQLAKFTIDPVTFVPEVIHALQTGDAPMKKAAAQALGLLPKSLPEDVVAMLAASDAVREVDGLLKVLTRYDAAAPALTRLCLEMLQQRKIGDYVVTIAELRDDRRYRLAAEALVALGSAAASARPVLLERLLTIDETMSLQGSLRKWLIHALGGRKGLLAELEPGIETLERSGEPRRVKRAEELRRWLKE